MFTIDRASTDVNSVHLSHNVRQGVPQAIRRALHVLFTDPDDREDALAPWHRAAVCTLWVTGRLVSPISQERLLQLTDPNRLTSLTMLASSTPAVGKVVGVLFADGTLAAAVASDQDALHAWQQATLGVGASPETAPAEVVQRLLGANRLVVADTLSERCAFRFSDVPDHPLRFAAVRRLMLNHLALALYAQDLMPTGNGALAQALVSARTAPIDARSHLPPPDQVEYARASTPPLPPDPDRDPQALIRWCQHPVTAGPYALSRLLVAVHRDRPDLMETFLDTRTVRDRVALWRWASRFGHDPQVGAGLPRWAVRPPVPLPVDPPHGPAHNSAVGSPTAAVQVVGYLDAVLGLGEAARLVVRALDGAGESVETVTYRHLVSDRTPWVERRRDGLPRPDISITCLSGLALARYHRSNLPADGWTPYRIGLWFWETKQLSADMQAGLHLIDEVWVTSTFTAEAVRVCAPSTMPVQVMPLGVQLDQQDHTGATPRRPSPRQGRLTVAASCPALKSVVDRPWCGFSFDLASRLIRKNPLGLIEAWTLAYREPAAPVLVIKTINGTANANAFAELLHAAQGRADIVVINEAWDAHLHHAFIGALSLYVSLHRSEGYGLVLLEALARGIPVIATGATGNLAFMTEANSWLVPADSTVLTTTDGMYGAGEEVFEPDINAAAATIRTLMTGDPIVAAEVERRRVQGQLDVAGLASGDDSARWIAHRLAMIRALQSNRS
jgi:glycosyltransferase involved in cell wall biosynthesis